LCFILYFYSPVLVGCWDENNFSQISTKTTFINSLYDRETKLFAPTVGSIGDLKATALAHSSSLQSLNKLQSEEVKSKFDNIKKKHLQTLKKSKDGEFSFFSAITSDNYVRYHCGIFRWIWFRNWKGMVQILQPTPGSFWTCHWVIFHWFWIPRRHYYWRCRLCRKRFVCHWKRLPEPLASLNKLTL